MFPQVRSVKVHRAALWILGEYATSKDDIEAVMDRIRAGLGDLPLVEAENNRQAGEKSLEENAQNAPAQLVTSDGTYATQSAFNSTTIGNCTNILIIQFHFLFDVNDSLLPILYCWRRL